MPNAATHPRSDLITGRVPGAMLCALVAAACAHPQPSPPRDPVLEQRAAIFRDFARSLPPCGPTPALTVAAVQARQGGGRQVTVAGRAIPACTAEGPTEYMESEPPSGKLAYCGPCYPVWILVDAAATTGTRTIFIEDVAKTRPVLVLMPPPDRLLSCDAEAAALGAPGLTVAVTGKLTSGKKDGWLALDVEAICRARTHLDQSSLQTRDRSKPSDASAFSRGGGREQGPSIR
jgi:hypothetical protein